MQTYEHLDIAMAGAVAQVTINRPHRLNTLSSDAHREMEELWPDLGERDDVDAVVLCGAGDVFSAGGDVKEMLELARSSSAAGSGISTARARRLVYGMLDFEKPLVAAVEGRAVGLGATLALLCDFVVAADGSVFSDPHVNLGLVPGDGGAAIWTVLVGPHRARDLLMRGRVVDAALLHRLGLVVETTASGQALATALDLATELTAQPRLALRGTKIAINAYVKGQFVPVFETSLAYEASTLRSGDFREGVAALGDKRRPMFTDR